jgi:hypothetical protein
LVLFPSASPPLCPLLLLLLLLLPAACCLLLYLYASAPAARCASALQNIPLPLLRVL